MKIKIIGGEQFVSNNIQCDADETLQTIELTFGKLQMLDINLSEAECIVKMLGQWIKIFNQQNKKNEKSSKELAKVFDRLEKERQEKLNKNI